MDEICNFANCRLRSFINQKPIFTSGVYCTFVVIALLIFIIFLHQKNLPHPKRGRFLFCQLLCFFVLNFFSGFLLIYLFLNRIDYTSFLLLLLRYFGGGTPANETRKRWGGRHSPQAPYREFRRERNPRCAFMFVSV